jgi:hypothetical protein
LDRYPELDDYLDRQGRVVASSRSDIVWALPPASAPGPSKVFCIGLTKTGTTSLHHALLEMGFTSLHWGGRDAFHGVLRAQRDGARLLRDVGEQYDAYSDIGPLSVRFDLLELQYPGSKFVITIRDVEEWIESRRKHVERNSRNRGAGRYAGTNVAVHEHEWRDQWRSHVERVTGHFAGRDDLLIVDLCADPRWDRIAAHLGRPAPSGPFPRELVHRATSDSVPLHLGCRRDGSLVLVEGPRMTEVTGNDRLAFALRRVVGSPTALADHPEPGAAAPADGIVFVHRAGVRELAASLSGPVEVAVPAEVADELAGCGARLHPIALRWSPRTGGADPDGGRGALDLLASSRARGATHLLLTGSSAWWLERYDDLAEHLARRGRVVAANDAGVVWALPRAPSPGPAKVFCIGLPRTGTWSLHCALRQLGLSSEHWAGTAAFQAVLAAQRDGARLLRDVGEQYDAYSQINPLSVRFDLLDLQYPGSKFVLTVRDVDDWIDSRTSVLERKLWRNSGGSHSRHELEIAGSRWRDEWRIHVDRVAAYFAGRDDLLVLDLCAKPCWDELAPFLGRPVPDTPFPPDLRPEPAPAWLRFLRRAVTAGPRR